jgi:MbtH protein
MSVDYKKDTFKQKYAVLLNREGMYSYWRVEKPIPDGWKTMPFTGSEEECLDYIDENWTDMRPLRLRNKMST